MMLRHIGQAEVATKISNAWLRALEDGMHTADIFREGFSAKRLGTQAFAQAIIDRLGETPVHLQAEKQGSGLVIQLPDYQRENPVKELVGVDIFLDWTGSPVETLGDELAYLAGPDLQLKMITNRGVKVYPGGQPDTFCTDHWRCRFVAANAQVDGDNKIFAPIRYEHILELLSRLHTAGLQAVKTEQLYLFDGKRGFSLGQGE